MSAARIACECESRFCSHHNPDGNLRDCPRKATMKDGLALCPSCRKDFEASK